MKKILFILTLAAVVAGCKKDGINITEADILGTWIHQLTVNPDGTTAEDEPLVMEVTADHEMTMYAGGNYETYSWKINGNQIATEDIHGDGDVFTVSKADGKHLVYSWKTELGTYKGTWINIEKVLPGEWTVQWLAAAQYVNIKEDGTSVWTDVATGKPAGTYSWEIHIDIAKSRALIQYKGNLWNDMEPIYSASDEVLWVTNKDGGPGKYTRGKLDNAGPLVLER